MSKFFCFAVALLLGSSAKAQEERLIEVFDGVYMSVALGASFNGRANFDVMGRPPFRLGGSVALKQGLLPSGRVSIGNSLSDNFRGEIEVFYSMLEMTDYDYDRVANLGMVESLDLNELMVSGGDAQVGGITFNIYYDLNRGKKFTPYIGIGGGMARIAIDSDATLMVPRHHLDDQDDDVYDDGDDSFFFDGVGSTRTNMGQIILGGDYELNDKINVFGNFRGVIYGSGEIELDDNAGTMLLERFNGTRAELGIRVNFTGSRE